MMYWVLVLLLNVEAATTIEFQTESECRAAIVTVREELRRDYPGTIVTGACIRREKAPR
jgi:hypothetical protein